MTVPSVFWEGVYFICWFVTLPLFFVLSFSSFFSSGRGFYPEGTSDSSPVRSRHSLRIPRFRAFERADFGLRSEASPGSWTPRAGSSGAPATAPSPRREPQGGHRSSERAPTQPNPSNREREKEAAERVTFEERERVTFETNSSLTTYD